MLVIASPPRDNDGQVIPHDHSEISNNDEVIRRISQQQTVLDKDGQRIISSMAYKASSGKNGGMSVDLKQLIEKDGLDPKDYVTTPRWMGSVLFKVSELRAMEFKVGYNPIEPPSPDPNPYHGEVWGRFSGSQTRRLKTLAVWFVPIPNVNLT
jgi:hypothetical protein